MNKDPEEICKCGDSRAWHNRKGCTATWKMGTEWCDCTKFEPK